MKFWMTELRSDKHLRLALLLSLLLLAACGYCLYQFAEMKESTRRLAALEERLQTVARLQSHFPPGAATRSQLLTSLQQSAQRHQIAVSAWDESGDGVAATLPPLAFEPLARWLATLQREQGIRVVALAVDHRQQPPGVVKVARLVFSAQPEL